jgi:hypothetical protein
MVVVFLQQGNQPYLNVLAVKDSMAKVVNLAAS